MVQDAVAVINDDESVDITEAAGKSASADIYEKLVNAGNREVSKAILCQTLTTELDKGGSYAATKEHMEVRADLVGQDKRMVCVTFNLVFQWITELNIARAAAPTFGFFEEEDIQEERAGRDEKLNRQGVTFTKKYYMRTYNLEEDDLELRNETPASPGNNEFAETEPDVADAYADRMDKEGAGLIDELIEPIRKLVQSASSLEEIRDGLIDLYPDMEAGDFAALMEQALTAAELAGRYEVREGT
jgi:phage gp29-like protein